MAPAEALKAAAPSQQTPPSLWQNPLAKPPKCCMFCTDQASQGELTESKGRGRGKTAGIVPGSHRRSDKWLWGAAEGRRAFLKLLSLLQEDFAGAVAGTGVQSARGRTNTRWCNIWTDTHQVQTCHMGTRCCQIHFSHAFLWLFFIFHTLL